MLQAHLTTRQRRVCYIAGGFFIAVIILVARLFVLQILQASHYRQRGEHNYTRTITIEPPRGSLFDRHGTLLATNQSHFDLYWVGSLGRLSPDAVKDHITAIAQLIDPTLTEPKQLRSITRADRQGRTVSIGRALDFETLCRVTEAVPGAPLEVKSVLTRSYPLGPVACQVLGHLTRQDQSGACGIEGILDESLHGIPGSATFMTNARGRKLKPLCAQPATQGDDETLTIDSALQQKAADLFAPDQAGALVLMDPISGDLHVLHSNPVFDPNMFSHQIPTSLWREVNKSNPFLNRACQALYPPASLFKLITFAAGLETGAITPDTVFPCTGFAEFGGRKYYCQRRWGHGSISLKKAIAASCNVPCYEIAKRITIDDLANYAARFGLGARSDCTLNDRAGLVPTSRWKHATKGEPWWPGETLSASIGQTYLLVTPLQIARMIGAVFTGLLVKPRIMLNEEKGYETIDVLPSTLSFLQEAMYAVAKEGTARSFGKLKDFVVFAKTGTAQTARLDKKKQMKSDFEHAWFSCCFSYKQQRPMVLVVLVEHAGTSRPAMDIAREFLRSFATRPHTPPVPPQPHRQ